MIERGRSVRRHDLDFIRVAAFVLLMFYHASLIFGTRGWLVHADDPSRVFDVIALASHPWRLSLLFLIAGMTTANLWQRQMPEEIRSRRTRQLVVPLLIGIFVLVPPQIYILAISDFGLDMSYLDFWGLYLRFGAIGDQDGNPISVVSMQHLWFIAYLWLYTMVTTIIMARYPAWLRWTSDTLARVLRGYGFLLWPAAYLALMRLAVYPLFGETLDVVRDWYAHTVYLSFFVLGLLMANHESFWTEVVAWRKFAAWSAYLCFGFMVALFVLYPPGDRSAAVIALHRLARSGLQWFAIVAILGFAKVLITQTHPVVTYLNRAILSYYVTHQTVLLIVAYWLKKLVGFGTSSFVIIVLATMLICAALYEVQRQGGRLIAFGRRRVAAAIAPAGVS